MMLGGLQCNWAAAGVQLAIAWLHEQDTSSVILANVDSKYASMDSNHTANTKTCSMRAEHTRGGGGGWG